LVKKAKEKTMADNAENQEQVADAQNTESNQSGDVQQQQQDGNGQQQQQPQQKSIFQTISNFMITYFLITTAMKWITGGGDTSGAASTESVAGTVQSPVIDSTASGDPMYDPKMVFRPALRNHEEFRFDVFFGESGEEDLRKVEQMEKVWSERGLYYNWDEKNFREKNVTVPMTEELQNNGTISAYFVAASRRTKKEEYKMWNQIPLVKFHKKKAVVLKQNLMTGENNEEEYLKHNETKIMSYWKPAVIFNMIHDTTSYTMGSLPKEMKTFIEFDPENQIYWPVLYMNDFWVLPEDMVELNSTVTEAQVNLQFYPESMWKVMVQHSMSPEMQSKNPLTVMSEDEVSDSMEEMKRIFLKTNKILLGATVIVSLLHTVFEFLAIGADIKYWRQNENLVGISVRTLWMDLVCHVVITLYMLDNETSYYIYLSLFLEFFMMLWKIKKTTKSVTFDSSFPFMHFEELDSYKDSPTKKYDEIAVKYCSIALFPLMVGYTIYSIIYNEHKGWYSFFLETSSSFIYTFGFIKMTPQLYINYRLKSVEHMPWKPLIYRSINTFIDDLFAFVVTVPTLYRISCFRDDIIFFIYLYQRWAYRVDKSRGFYAENEEKKEELKEGEEQKAAITEEGEAPLGDEGLRKRHTGVSESAEDKTDSNKETNQKTLNTETPSKPKTE